MADQPPPNPPHLQTLLVRNAELEVEVKLCRKELKNAQDAAMLIVRTLMAAPRSPTLEEELAALQSRSQHFVAENKQLQKLLEAEMGRSRGLADAHDRRLKDIGELNDELRQSLESERYKFQARMAELTAEKDQAQLAFVQLRTIWNIYCSRNNLPGAQADAVINQIGSSIPSGPAIDGAHHDSNTPETYKGPGPAHPSGALNNLDSMGSFSVTGDLKSGNLVSSQSMEARLKAGILGENRTTDSTVHTLAQNSSTYAGASRPEDKTGSLMSSKCAQVKPAVFTFLGSQPSGHPRPSDAQTARTPPGSEIIDHNGSSNYVEPYRFRGRGVPSITENEHRDLANQACFIEDKSYEEQMDFWDRFHLKWPSHSANDWKSYYYQQIRPGYLAGKAESVKKTADQDSSPHPVIERSIAKNPVSLGVEVEDAEANQLSSRAIEQENLIEFNDVPLSTIINNESGEETSSALLVDVRANMKPSLEDAVSCGSHGDPGGAETKTEGSLDAKSASTEISSKGIEHIGQEVKAKVETNTKDLSFEDTTSRIEAHDESSSVQAHGPDQMPTLVNQSSSTVDREYKLYETHEGTARFPGEVTRSERRVPDYHVSGSDPPRTAASLSMNMVVISEIPEDMELVNVLQRVCNGRIVSATMCQTQGLTFVPPIHGQTVLVVFASAQKANEYVDFRSRHPLVLYSVDSSTKTICSVQFAPTATNRARLYGSIRPPNMVDTRPPTRCLFFLFSCGCQAVFTADQLEGAIKLDTGRSGQISMYGAAIKTPLRRWDGKMQFVGMEFASIRDATKALCFFKRFSILTGPGVSMGFYPDSCEKMFSEMLSEEQKLELAFQTGTTL